MDEKDSEKKPHQKKRNSFLCWGIMLIGSVAVFISVRYFPSLLKEYTHAQSVVGLGEYGDIYGGLNTLFTGLAFVGLVVTILLQRQEMRETREEFEEQTKQFKAQSEIMTKQVLDAAMFEYLKYMGGVHSYHERQAMYQAISMLLSAIDIPQGESVSSVDGVIHIDDAKVKSILACANQLRVRLRTLAAWRRVYVSWSYRVKQEVISNTDNQELYLQYIGSLWHLLSLEDRFLLYLQMAFLAVEHKGDWEAHNSSYGDSPAIQTAFTSLGMNKMRQSFLIDLLSPKGEGSLDRVKLSCQQVLDIVESHIKE